MEFLQLEWDIQHRLRYRKVDYQGDFHSKCQMADRSCWTCHGYSELYVLPGSAGGRGWQNRDHTRDMFDLRYRDVRRWRPNVAVLHGCRRLRIDARAKCACRPGVKLVSAEMMMKGRVLGGDENSHWWAQEVWVLSAAHI
jgi:hypothetical protein